jgi:hypothetical protein
MGVRRVLLRLLREFQQPFTSVGLFFLSRSAGRNRACTEARFGNRAFCSKRLICASL